MCKELARSQSSKKVLRWSFWGLHTSPVGCSSEAWRFLARMENPLESCRGMGGSHVWVVSAEYLHGASRAAGAEALPIDGSSPEAT